MRENRTGFVVLRSNRSTKPEPLAGDLLILAAPEFTEGENLILRERTTVKGDKWTGKTLKEVPLSKGTLVVSVRRGEETLIPTGNTRIQEGDILIIAKY